MDNVLFLNILLSIIGAGCLIGVKQLISIANSINEIKTQFQVLNTKHDYLEDRVKTIEKKINV